MEESKTAAKGQDSILNLMDMPIEIIAILFRAFRPEKQANVGACCKSLYAIYSDKKNNLLGWRIKNDWKECLWFTDDREPLKFEEWKKTVGEANPALEISFVAIRKNHFDVFRWCITKEYKTLKDCFEWTHEWEEMYPMHYLFEGNKPGFLRILFEECGTDLISDCMTSLKFTETFFKDKYIECWKVCLECLVSCRGTIEVNMGTLQDILRLAKDYNCLKLTNEVPKIFNELFLEGVRSIQGRTDELSGRDIIERGLASKMG